MQDCSEKDFPFEIKVELAWSIEIVIWRWEIKHNT